MSELGVGFGLGFASKDPLRFAETSTARHHPCAIDTRSLSHERDAEDRSVLSPHRAVMIVVASILAEGVVCKLYRILRQ